ncbi:hypothetical protein [Mycobacterium sp. EPa45]|uniref:hypothetical protein n=1 Tax=Mycobacterium sp. EPa45 TaxID=1545728 RepID=UPI000642161B|nr:hypothetical protein [Mycobacterium sp. EPa45]AKK27120.1 hypothetical protein AB431_11015 [Mycobacterium sp. EPa45]
MGRYASTTRTKFATATAVSALAVGVLATTGLGSAPPAGATCASFFGFGNTPNCTSGPTSIAIAIGNGATAFAADGWLSTALSFGTNAFAITGQPGTTTALSFATAIGDNSIAQALGIIGMATQLGPNGEAVTVGAPTLSNLGLNVALNISLGSTVPVGSFVEAYGLGNIAVNLFGNGTTAQGHYAVAVGNFTTAMNLFGTDNKTYAGFPGGGTLSLAFADFGSGNTVHAGAGPLAIAGSIGQTGQTVIKEGPGFNINGVVVAGGAAAVDPTSTAAAGSARPAKPAARSGRPASATGNKTPASARSTGSSKTGSSKRG